MSDGATREAAGTRRGPLVEAIGVGRRFGRGDGAVDALLMASCVVRAGDRIAIIGPSGSGKSTLLHILAGIDVPTTGDVHWPALGPREALRPVRLAMIYQVPSLLDALSVVENVALPLLLAGADPVSAHTAATEALDSLDLSNLAERLPEEISGGQAQRAAAARALVVGPRLILADEPTGQLDHPTAQHLFDVLLAALRGRDTALVVATHDPAVAARLGETWTMRHGVLSTGPTGSA